MIISIATDEAIIPIVLGNQADAVIWFWNISLVYKFVISYIYSLVCNGIRFILSQTNVQLGFCNKLCIVAITRHLKDNLSYY